MKSLFLTVSGIVAGLVSFSQDTFSIVAVDTVTGEVGAAGASCVDLFASGAGTDDFICQLFPAEGGAIATQASYHTTNQANAKFRMFDGYTPSEIIDWLEANDVTGNPETRQYGVVRMVDGSPESAGWTGTGTSDYKNHIVGPNYCIQGNILLGPEILDSMEARFLAAEGDLKCKLMAAMQGANVVGADSRCADNNSSSLFAFLKVAQPDDDFGSPSFLVSVRTHDGDSIEPIDSLQILFDAAHDCASLSIDEFNIKDEELIGIYDLLGRPSQPVKGRILIYRYSSGRVEKKVWQ